MKKINTGSSDFSDLRKVNVIYVDKTAYMRRLASDEEHTALPGSPLYLYLPSRCAIVLKKLK